MPLCYKTHIDVLEPIIYNAPDNSIFSNTPILCNPKHNAMNSPFKSDEIKSQLPTGRGKTTIFHLPKFERLGFKNIHQLPFSIKILLESAIRNFDNYQVTFESIQNLADWSARTKAFSEIAFKPGRVILQDFTGVPCIVDLAAMRSAMKRIGGDYRKINPQVPCDLVIDHSVQVDFFGSKTAFAKNVEKEFERNKERYEFLKWGQMALKNFRVVPPATGIVHQVNLEYLAKGVLTKKSGSEFIAYPDSLVGTDSHTPMINGLGVVGWGVGGIEAEAVMLGEPIYMLMPEVIGFRLKGRLKEGVTATDLVLTVTQILRQKGVVGKFVEFCGDGIKSLSLPDRATISNMSPEYGATIGIFPIDQETLRYYQITGRTKEEVDLIERYMKEQQMFFDSATPEPQFSDIVELDLEGVEPSLAGPKRPQDKIALKDLKSEFRSLLSAPVEKRGFGLTTDELTRTAVITNGTKTTLSHGSVVIAAITSCTNTSNPSVLIAAALLAKNAIQKGLKVKGYVKTSFAPGSMVVTEYLKNARLMPYLEKLGFHLVGYGCTTCIGNSGPLSEKIAHAINEGNLVVCSVLSGNRNFEGRINPLTQASFLTSPPLVVAYALAGTVNIDLTKEPLGKGADGREVYLKDIWPRQEEIQKIILKEITAAIFHLRYKDVLKGDKNWDSIKTKESDLYDWKKESTYIQEPSFFVNMKEKPDSMSDIRGVRVLVMLGDSITTDHISPAGAISTESPAGIYLKELGVNPQDFNSYGSRRGNDRIMTRGTFANIRLRNLLAPGTQGSWTIHFPTNKTMDIYGASLRYKKDNTPLVVLAGKEYGAGSSRDWAAKGTALLGVKVVLAESYERIHRSNLVGMGVLPLEYKPGTTRESLGIRGDEVFDFIGLSDKIKPRQEIKVVVAAADGSQKEFHAMARLDTPVDIEYYRNGGILQTVLRKLAK